jgi:PAS domain-containing protein
MPFCRGADVSAALLLLQTLTNLNIAPTGMGLPAGWRLQRIQGVEAPTFRVTRAHVLRIEAPGGGQAGTAVYRLRAPIRPPPATRPGALTWRWRAETPLRAAVLRHRATDDSPVRVIVTFEDGRVLAYTWGNREGRGESFASWAGRNRMIVILQRAEDADGSWHVERRDPFADYRRLWNNAPKPIVSVGMSTDTDGLRARTAAEVGDITWQGRD